MNLKFQALALAAAAAALSGCVITASEHRRGGYEGGAVVVAEPTYIEEGAYYGGVVVAPVDPNEYVWINGAWYYYHPTHRVWVHAHRPGNWQPPRQAHVYHSWNEHPMYRQPPAPPVVVRPEPRGPDPRGPVIVAAPTTYEEGDRIGGAVIKYPGSVDAFVFTNGTYYYYHPTFRVWVHSRHDRDWSPPRGVVVYRGWGEHPAFRGGHDRH